MLSFFTLKIYIFFLTKNILIVGIRTQYRVKNKERKKIINQKKKKKKPKREGKLKNKDTKKKKKNRKREKAKLK